MQEAKMREMVLEILLETGDVGLYKSTHPDTAEDPAEAEATMQRMLGAVRKFLPRESSSSASSAPTTGKRLYVGNLTYGTEEQDLQEWFEAYGTVQSAWIVSDRETGRSKGFGFVEMGTKDEAAAAVEALNGQEKDGRVLTVSVARPKPEGGERSSGGGGGRSFGGDKRGGRRQY